MSENPRPPDVKKIADAKKMTTIKEAKTVEKAMEGLTIQSGFTDSEDASRDAFFEGEKKGKTPPDTKNDAPPIPKDGPDFFDKHVAALEEEKLKLEDAERNTFFAEAENAPVSPDETEVTPKIDESNDVFETLVNEEKAKIEAIRNETGIAQAKEDKKQEQATLAKKYDNGIKTTPIGNATRAVGTGLDTAFSGAEKTLYEGTSPTLDALQEAGKDSPKDIVDEIKATYGITVKEDGTVPLGFLGANMRKYKKTYARDEELQNLMLKLSEQHTSLNPAGR